MLSWNIEFHSRLCHVCAACFSVAAIWDFKDTTTGMSEEIHAAALRTVADKLRSYSMENTPKFAGFPNLKTHTFTTQMAKALFTPFIPEENPTDYYVFDVIIQQILIVSAVSCLEYPQDLGMISQTLIRRREHIPVKNVAIQREIPQAKPPKTLLYCRCCI